MMKIGFFAFLLIVSHAMASVPMEFRVTNKQIVKAPPRSPDLDLCPLCIQFAGEFINQLLNIILNAGVVGGCGELCSALADKTGSKTAGEVCDVLCAVVGIDEFIKIIQNADLDPIYYCEELKVCPIKDDGDAKITDILIFPKTVSQGSSFHINVTFVSMNGTGTGEIEVEIDTQDGIPIGDSELQEPLAPGRYTVSWRVRAEPDPDCDPTQGPCEQWLPGNYTVNVAICNGQCGSKHPHSQLYDTGSAPFQVTR